MGVGAQAFVSNLVGRFVTTPDHIRDMIVAMQTTLDQLDKASKGESHVN